MLKSERGITFIELLIAVSIISVMGAAVYTTLVQGLALWKRSILVEPRVDSEILFEKMTTDLRNTFGKWRTEFSGSGNSVEFFSVNGDVLATVPSGAPVTEPVRVSYHYDPAQRTLYRGSRPLSEHLLKPGGEITGKPVAEGVDCRFTYYHLDTKRKSYQWKDFWDKGCPPAAIRISLKYDDDSKIDSQTRIIGIPAACPAA